MDILFVASEMYPLVKTGGLADVAGHLPPALEAAGHRVTVIIPAYAQVLEKLDSEVIGHITTASGYALIREARQQSGPRLWLVDHPVFAQRHGNPYVDANGEGYDDNGFRFGLFCKVVSYYLQTPGVDFDVVHCNDWQTGLVPVYLRHQQYAPPVLFTIHNLAYQGNFAPELRHLLHLPEDSWHMHGMEYYGQLSFMKAGLQYSRKISTVSPNYAQEIQQEEFAYGMAGVLRSRKADLIGILNGIDSTEWSPASDPNLACRYDIDSLPQKLQNKRALQQRFGLPQQDGLLLGNVGRLAEQKGMDLVLDALPRLMQLPLQLVVAGSGDKALEMRLRDAAAQWPDKMACFIGYDEALAHQLEAGADAFLMPSRFEPCGLNQMYSMAYGTPPIVTPTGGLADTVDDDLQEQATGFIMSGIHSHAVIEAVERALAAYADPAHWQRLQRNGMQRNFTWSASAAAYARLYQSMLS